MSSSTDFERRIYPSRASVSIALGAILLIPGALAAQSFKASDLAPAPQSQSLAGRTQNLNQIFHDYWQDKLKHSPEFASAIGDKRYDDQLSDYSPKAYNDALARGAQFIERLGAIDTTGMSEQEKSKKDLLVRHLIDQQESSTCKPWQTPVAPLYGIHLELPLLAQALSFTSADDYDQYVARLNRIPAAFMQITTDMSLGQEAGRSEPPTAIRGVLAPVNEIASVNPEGTPFAYPLHQFPPGVSPQQQAEIRKQVLTSIRTQVQPAYARFAKFLSTEYIPQASKQAQKQPEVAAETGGVDCSVSSAARDFDAGRIKTLELRMAAEKALGKNFNLAAFRDEVKTADAAPTDILEKQVEAWIAQQQQSTTR